MIFALKVVVLATHLKVMRQILLRCAFLLLGSIILLSRRGQIKLYKVRCHFSCVTKNIVITLAITHNCAAEQTFLAKGMNAKSNKHTRSSQFDLMQCTRTRNFHPDEYVHFQFANNIKVALACALALLFSVATFSPSAPGKVVWKIAAARCSKLVRDLRSERS